jgi:nucleotide-binding universal stress UspA family protein
VHFSKGDRKQEVMRPYLERQAATGLPGVAAIGVAQEYQSHLLVVGTGDHVGLRRIMLRSTCHYCLGHASCPVVAVPALDAAPPGE